MVGGGEFQNHILETETGRQAAVMQAPHFLRFIA